MYHFVADQPPVPLILSTTAKTKPQVLGHICQYLKSFQIEAIRFLHTHLSKRELCVLNDESGLGKTASVSVCLAATLSPAPTTTSTTYKKCLIVVQNDDTLVAGWQFHFNVLTTAAVTVINGVKDATRSQYNVYIAKWGTLRSIGDLSQFSFDYIVLDNRGQMLNNNFCTSMLLKHYEKKVNIVISSVDITSDTKLMHNILRLGGRLEQQYESYKVFETKFKLPDSKEVFSNKNSVDLEEYFQKREILNFYCKKFRLRRYRHQYEQLLPLVEADRYQINLELWRTSTHHSNSNSDQTVETLVSSENGTEELFEQFYSIKKRQELRKSKPLELTPLSTPSTPSIILSGCAGVDVSCEQNIGNNEAVDICDTPVVMSPLLFVSDSESESSQNEQEQNVEETVAVTPPKGDEQNSIEIVDLTSECIKIVSVESESVEKPSKKKLTTPKEIKKATEADKISKMNGAEKRSLRSHRRKSIENKRLKRKQEKPQKISDLKNTKKYRLRKLENINKNELKEKVERPHSTRLRTTELVTKCMKHLKTDKPSSPSTKKNVSNETKSPSTPLLKQNKPNLNENKNLQTPKRTLRTGALVKNNKENETKKTSALEAPKSSSTKPKQNSSTHAKSPRTPTTPASADKRNKPQMPVTSHIGLRTTAITPKGIHNKTTRSMQRMTRSSGATLKNKYMLTALALDIDKKPGRVVKETKNRKTLPEKNHDTETKENIAVKHVKPTTSKSSNKSPSTSSGINMLKPKVKKAQPPVKNTKNHNVIITKAARKFSQNSILSTSDYEDIQCGHRLESSSEHGSVVRMLEKPPISSNTDFLIPPTPHSMRNSQFSLLPSLFIESDVIFVPPSPSAANQRNQNVIVVTSSQDECSLSSSQSQTQSSQSRRTRALKQKKSSTMTITTATQKLTTTTQRVPTFGELLAKQQTGTATTVQQRSTSPDLFSNCSDLVGGGIDCTQARNNSGNSSNNRTPFDGFKIFGSEVKQFQQQHAATAAAKASSNTSTKPSRVERSCLNILEKMFEPRHQQQQQQQKQKKTTTFATANTSQQQSPTKNHRRAKTPILPAHPIEAIANTQKEEAAALARSQKKRPLLEEDIFEISNNGTFGSVLRLNSNGEVSPVQQKQSQHNKITNYYIGSGGTQPPTRPTTPANAETTTEVAAAATTTSLGTPSKIQRTKERLLSGTATRKSSPKSTKSQQATKLTRWFLKNSNSATAQNNSNNNSVTEDEEVEMQAANIKVEPNSQIESKKKTTRRSNAAAKRRRLELSFNKN